MAKIDVGWLYVKLCFVMIAAHPFYVKSIVCNGLISFICIYQVLFHQAWVTCGQYQARRYQLYLI